MNSTETDRNNRKQSPVSRSVYNSLVDVLSNCLDSIAGLAKKHGIKNTEKYTTTHWKHTNTDVSKEEYQELCNAYEGACEELFDFANGKTEPPDNSRDTENRSSNETGTELQEITETVNDTQENDSIRVSEPAETEEAVNTATIISEKNVPEDSAVQESEDRTDDDTAKTNAVEDMKTDAVEKEVPLPIEKLSLPEEFRDIDLDKINTVCTEILDFLSDREFLQKLYTVEDISLINPMTLFSEDVKKGKYDDIDEHRYQQVVKNMEDLSKDNWNKKSSISLSRNEIIDATQKLMEATETLYQLQRITDAVDSFNQTFNLKDDN